MKRFYLLVVMITLMLVTYTTTKVGASDFDNQIQYCNTSYENGYVSVLCHQHMSSAPTSTQYLDSDYLLISVPSTFRGSGYYMKIQFNDYATIPSSMMLTIYEVTVHLSTLSNNMYYVDVSPIDFMAEPHSITIEFYTTSDLTTSHVTTATNDLYLTTSPLTYQLTTINANDEYWDGYADGKESLYSEGVIINDSDKDGYDDTSYTAGYNYGTSISLDFALIPKALSSFMYDVTLLEFGPTMTIGSLIAIPIGLGIFTWFFKKYLMGR